MAARAARKQPLDHLRSRKKPNRTTITLALDPDEAQALDEAEMLVQRLESIIGKNAEAQPGNPVVEAYGLAVAERDELREKVRANSACFRIKSVGARAYEDLVAAHPPTKDQVAKAKKQNVPTPYNADTFPPALLALACTLVVDDVEQTLTEEEFRDEIWDNDDWNEGETMTLFTAAMVANSQARTVNLGNG